MPVVTQLLVATGFGALGIGLYPKIMKSIAAKVAKTNWMPEKAKSELTALSSAGVALSCPRNCSPGSVICLSEVGELLGGFGNWIQTRFALNPQEQQNSASSARQKAQNAQTRF